MRGPSGFQVLTGFVFAAAAVTGVATGAAMVADLADPPSRETTRQNVEPDVSRVGDTGVDPSALVPQPTPAVGGESDQASTRTVNRDAEASRGGTVSEQSGETSTVAKEPTPTPPSGAEPEPTPTPAQSEVVYPPTPNPLPGEPGWSSD